jgi:superfamily II DNA/RNA helicase
LWAMISHQPLHPKILNQIETGEGKSRIMMILAAYQASQGKTVDLLTSDLSLAERDYRQYQAFFMALEIPTSLMTLDTPAEFYEEKGIHFSTNDALSLLRHKSEVDGRPFAYLNQNPEARCLLVDEVDKLIDLDTSSKNYAAENSALAPFTWVYLRLMAWMKETPTMQPTPDDFFTYLNETHPYGEEIAQLKVLHENHPQQLTIWLQSARTASNMKKEVNFTIANEKVAIFDKLGRTHYITPVQVVENGCVLKGSTYRDGVHQCLVAGEILAAEHAKTDHALLIQPETSLRRSSYAINTLDRYQAGTVLGMSGTPSFLGKEDAATNPLKFFGIKVPREKLTRRESLPPILAKDFKQQMSYLKKALRAQAKRGDPLLLVTRDDEQSKAVFDAIKADPFFVKYHWNLLNAKTTDDAEQTAIHKAGQPFTVTIGTAGKLGRGVDVKVSDEHPLSLVALFDPETTGEETQIKGRTGRFGQKGTYRMILNQQDPLSIIPRTRHVERTIQEKQQKQSKEIEQQRTIIETLARFQETLHELWFEKGTLSSADWTKWEGFIDDFQKATIDLEASLEEKPTQDMAALFKSFTTKWLLKFAELVPEQDKSAQLIQAQKRADETVTKACTFLDNIGKHYPAIPKVPTVKKAYDIADDGQNVIYSTPFAQTRATLFGARPFFANTRAAREGRGEMFPEWRAILAGERPIFANTRAFLKRVFEWLRELFQRLFKSSQPQVATP